MQVIYCSDQLGLKVLHTLLCLAALMLSCSAQVGENANETLEISFEDCVTTVSCFSSQSERGNCTLQYGQEPSYQDLGPATNGSLNSSFSLPGLQSSTLYYIQATFILDSQLEPIIQRTNYTTGSSDEFTTTVIALSAVGLSVYVVAVVILTVKTKLCCVYLDDGDDDDDDKDYFKCRHFSCSKDGDYSVIFLHLTFIVCLVATILPLMLWIASFVFIQTAADSCTEGWQSTRDALFITSCFFSLLALVMVIAAAVLDFFLGFIHAFRQLKDD